MKARRSARRRDSRSRVDTRAARRAVLLDSPQQRKANRCPPEWFLTNLLPLAVVNVNLENRGAYFQPDTNRGRLGSRPKGCGGWLACIVPDRTDHGTLVRFDCSPLLLAAIVPQFFFLNFRCGHSLQSRQNSEARVSPAQRRRCTAHYAQTLAKGRPLHAYGCCRNTSSPACREGESTFVVDAVSKRRVRAGGLTRPRERLVQSTPAVVGLLASLSRQA